MNQNTCLACGRSFPWEGGHSCGEDSHATALRTQVATLTDSNNKLNDELSQLRRILNTINQFHSGQYNKWRHGSHVPNRLGLTEAIELIKAYFKNKPYVEQTPAQVIKKVLDNRK